MSISKRLWDLTRSNVTDFASAFTSEEVSEDIDIETESAGARMGRSARKASDRARDRAEDAWDRAFRAAQERAAQGARAAGYSPSTARSGAEQRREWYRSLELEEGASLDEVRRAYRKMVAKYHPDRFASDPEKHAAATEVARKITEAYDGLKAHLEVQG